MNSADQPAQRWCERAKIDSQKSVKTQKKRGGFLDGPLEPLVRVQSSRPSSPAY
jgi:hypothetical protein